MKIVKISFKFRDMWVGAFWRTYYRRFTSYFEYVEKPVCTDVWACPIPFVKIRIRIKHCEMTRDEENQVNEEVDELK